MQKFDDLMDEVESAQNRIRDKVERKVPKDVPIYFFSLLT